MALLITFGCSWTFGVGINYEQGMAKNVFESGAHNESLTSRYSFRGLLSQECNMINVNFSKGGSSNQEQFRLAENFFASNEFKQLQSEHQDIVVLWGLTSVLRNEAYSPFSKNRQSYFYSDRSMLSKAIVADHLDLQHEVYILGQKIKFWDRFFDAIGVKNLWFDTFNHHDYNILNNEVCRSYQYVAGSDWPSWQDFAIGAYENIDEEIKKEIFDSQRWDFYKSTNNTSKRLFKYNTYPRDLMNQLAICNGIVDTDSSYHESDWKIDNKKIEFLTSLGLLNPYSFHPTKVGHQQIAEMLVDLVKIS